MSLVVVDLELTAPLPSLPLPPGSRGALALVRRKGRPIGLVRLDHIGEITPEVWERAITEQVVEPLHGHPERGESSLISIVVCTHERPDDLRRCLDGLLQIGLAGHDVLVVDNAPVSHRTEDIVTRYPVRYLRESRKGLNHARNCGLKAARHPIVAYVDDDAVPDAAWAATIAEPFQVPAVGCVTGLVMPLELKTRAQQRFEVYCAHRRTFDRIILTSPQVPPATAGIAGMGANMAVRRAIALELGGFDPRLDAGTPTCSGGDTDMFARILEAGSHIVYTPDALVWHRHRQDDDALRRCIFGYGVGLSSFLTKRIIERRDLHAALVAARWLVGPFVKSAQHRIRNQPAVTPDLLFAEAIGMLLGPLRLWQASRQQRMAPSVAQREKRPVP
jgi:GT2 family glycosyltransferase